MGYLARYAEQEGAILAGKMITEHNSYARPWAQSRGYNRDLSLPSASYCLMEKNGIHQIMIWLIGES